MDGKTQLPHRGPRGKGGSMGNELVSFLSSITFETIGVGDFASLPGARIASPLIKYFLWLHDSEFILYRSRPRRTRLSRLEPKRRVGSVLNVAACSS
jgi:hypothetical protein